MEFGGSLAGLVWHGGDGCLAEVVVMGDMAWVIFSVSENRHENRGILRIVHILYFSQFLGLWDLFGCSCLI